MVEHFPWGRKFKICCLRIIWRGEESSLLILYPHIPNKRIILLIRPRGKCSIIDLDELISMVPLMTSFNLTWPQNKIEKVPKLGAFFKRPWVVDSPVVVFFGKTSNFPRPVLEIFSKKCMIHNLWLLWRMVNSMISIKFIN